MSDTVRCPACGEIQRDLWDYDWAQPRRADGGVWLVRCRIRSGPARLGGVRSASDRGGIEVAK